MFCSYADQAHWADYGARGTSRSHRRRLNGADGDERTSAENEEDSSEARYSKSIVSGPLSYPALKPRSVFAGFFKDFRMRP